MHTLAFLFVLVAFSIAAEDKHEAAEVHPPAGNNTGHNFIHDTWDTMKSSIHNGMEKFKGLFHHDHHNGTETHSPNSTAH